MKTNLHETFLSFLVLFVITEASYAQTKLDRALKNRNKETVPYIYVENIPSTDSIVYLDTREKVEFNVSHIKNAIWVGYSDFSEKNIIKLIPNKAQPIIVYCSIGVRSENIGEKLIAKGYTKVLNLYGGIIEWKNLGKEVYHNKNVTDSIHAFNKHWGKLLEKGIKVY